MSVPELDEATVTEWLATGREAARLRQYFGERLYRELVMLAREARRVPLRRAPRVLILPGMMGSTLGVPRRLGPPDVLWIDPLEIALGHLTRLAWPRGRKYRALGVLLFGYLRLKLLLRTAGLAAEFHAYDWRRDPVTLGRELLSRLEADSKPVRLVAHSYGGLVARAALALETQGRIDRVVFLGTPHRGAVSTVQALRGTYALVRRLAALDLKHSSTVLARQLLTTLPGLAALLPDASLTDGGDLFDRGTWPTRGPRPTATLLTQARRQRDALPAADERCVAIVGVGQRTVVGMYCDNGGFVYRTSRAGDGTVPIASAELPGAPAWYVEQSHGALANDAAVGHAVLELLATATSTVLPTTAPPQPSGTEIEREPPLAEAASRLKSATAKPLTAAARRALIAEFVSVPSSAAPRSTSRRKPPERGRAVPLQLQVRQANLADLRVDAVVAGVFRHVEAGGAAGSLDRRLDGTLTELLARRVFVPEAGAVFVLPTRGVLPAQYVIFAGLGDFDVFTPGVQRQVTTQVARTLVAARARSAGIVLMGAASGVDLPAALEAQFEGYLAGLAESTTLRRLVLTSRERARTAALRTLVAKHGTLQRLRVSEAPAARPSRVTPVSSPAPRSLYLISRLLPGAPGRWTLEAALLTASDKATVLAETRELSAASLDRLLGRLSQGPLTIEAVRRFGAEFAAEILPPRIVNALSGLAGAPLVVVHDAESGRLPWETLGIGDWQPAADRGLSRRYAAQGLAIARWRETRQLGETLELLLVVNPTEDLPGAEDEGQRVRAVLARHPEIHVTALEGSEATRERLLREFRSGRYDVLHFAGHAYFDGRAPARSGILCAGGYVLAGEDLADLEQLPALVFFNACESGRVRGGSARRERIRAGTGLAEAFLRGGVANYVGTWWPVGDAAAAAFATRFYSSLLAAQIIGSAVLAGRAAIRALRSGDWADYLHYGSADFRLVKHPDSPEVR